MAHSLYRGTYYVLVNVDGYIVSDEMYKSIGYAERVAKQIGKDTGQQIHVVYLNDWKMFDLLEEQIDAEQQED